MVSPKAKHAMVRFVPAGTVRERTRSAAEGVLCDAAPPRMKADPRGPRTTGINVIGPVAAAAESG